MIRLFLSRQRLFICLLAALPVAAGAASQYEAIALAKRAAAEQMDLSEASIKFVQAEAREWPDNSLGCPRKGMQYLPVVTAGHAVKLITQQETIVVHVAGDNAVICGSVTETPKNPRELRDVSVLSLIQLARADFGKRPDVDEQDIRIAGVTPTTWPDAGLGCAEEGVAYAQVRTPGYIIKLEAGDNTVTYHTDNEHIVNCDQ